MSLNSTTLFPWLLIFTECYLCSMWKDRIFWNCINWTGNINVPVSMKASKQRLQQSLYLICKLLDRKMIQPARKPCIASALSCTLFFISKFRSHSQTSVNTFELISETVYHCEASFPYKFLSKITACFETNQRDVKNPWKRARGCYFASY